jgi:hypothetical protein
MTLLALIAVEELKVLARREERRARVWRHAEHVGVGEKNRSSTAFSRRRNVRVFMIFFDMIVGWNRDDGDVDG